MAVELIKLTHNDQVTEFRPEHVIKINYITGSSAISIVLTSNNLITLYCASPTDALAKLARLEAAMLTSSGTIFELSDENER